MMMSGVFITMEEIIQSVLLKEIADQIDDGTKKKIMDKILGDEDLLFQWCFVVRTVVDIEHSEVLLTKITELYLTIRGNAFASSCLELYKQASKQTLQKKMGLRKKTGIKQIGIIIDNNYNVHIQFKSMKCIKC